MKIKNKVKTIKITALVVLLSVFFMSCEDFLEEAPDSILTEANFYKTESDAISAIDAIYASVQTGNQGMYWAFFLSHTDATTDDVFVDPGVGNTAWQGFGKLNIDPNIGILNATWDHHYRTIARANTAIDKISTELTIRDKLVAEAKFFRAIAYFDLVRYFGDVPLTTRTIENLDEAYSIASTRTPSTEIYELIEADLLEAEQNLPNIRSGADAGRITAGAAKGLLAKVYLTWAGAPLNDVSKYQLAADKAGELVNNRGIYGYDLESNYLDVFVNDLSKESLFEAQTVKGAGPGGSGTGSLLGIMTFPRQLNGILGSNYRGNALVRPTPDLINAFDPSDLRYQTGFFTSLTNADGSATATFDPHIFKYVQVEDLLYQGLVLNDGDRNTKILRFADILLIYAEALNEVNSAPTAAAFGAVNEIRARAGLANLNTSLDKDGFRNAVYLERRFELFAEGHRWFDLVRQGRFVSTMQNFSNTMQDFPNPATTSTFVIEKNIKPYHVLFPLPQNQLNLLNLEEDIQNPGY